MASKKTRLAAPEVETASISGDSFILLAGFKGTKGGKPLLDSLSLSDKASNGNPQHDQFYLFPIERKHARKNCRMLTYRKQSVPNFHNI